jgi:rhodanese-related sulfurtransferase
MTQEFQVSQNQTQEVDVQAVHTAMQNGDAVLIDVREPWEYDELHIPGSLLIPLGEVPARLGEIPSDRDVYVHCRLGGRSAKAVDFLREAGRPRAVNVTGGIEAWAAAGLPTAVG